MSIAYEHIEALPAQDTERQREPIPRSKAAAREPFRCDTLGCRLSGVSCAQRHRGVQEGRVDSTETCGTCPAGAARLRLLGAEVPTPQDSAAKRAKLAGLTARQRKAVHRADGWIKGSYERSEARGRRKAVCLAADGQTRGAQAAPRADIGAWAQEGASMGTTTMRLVEPVSEAEAEARPSKTREPVGKCQRAGCTRDVGYATKPSKLWEFCQHCRDSATVTLRRRMGRAPTPDEKRAWLVATPKLVLPEPCKAAVTQPLPVVTVEPATDAPIPMDPEPVPVPASVDALARLTMQRDDAEAAADRLRDQLDAAWKECGELRRDLSAALKAGREWRRVAESAMGMAARRREGFARGFMLGAVEYVDAGR